MHGRGPYFVAPRKRPGTSATRDAKCVLRDLTEKCRLPGIGSCWRDSWARGRGPRGSSARHRAGRGAVSVGPRGPRPNTARGFGVGPADRRAARHLVLRRVHRSPIFGRWPDGHRTADFRSEAASRPAGGAPRGRHEARLAVSRTPRRRKRGVVPSSSVARPTTWWIFRAPRRARRDVCRLLSTVAMRRRFVAWFTRGRETVAARARR